MKAMTTLKNLKRMISTSVLRGVSVIKVRSELSESTMNVFTLLLKSLKIMLILFLCGISLASAASVDWGKYNHQVLLEENNQNFLKPEFQEFLGPDRQNKNSLQRLQSKRPYDRFYFYGKEWVGGGGIIENEFVMVWQRRAAWMNPCLASPSSCQLDESEIQTLKLILTNLQGPELLFGSFSEFPELYPHQLGPEGVVATHPIAGSQVYVNAEVLYAKGVDPLRFRGVQRPITHLYAALLYQLGIPLTQAFTISSKVALFWNNYEVINHLGSIGFQDLNVTYFRNDPVVFLINDHRAMKDFTPWLQAQLPCENQGQQAILRQLKNTYWQSTERHGPMISASLKGSIVYTCLGKTSSHDFKADLNIYLVFKESSKKPGYFENVAEENRADIYYRE